MTKGRRRSEDAGRPPKHGEAILQAVDVLDVTDRQRPDNDTDRLSVGKLIVLSLLSGLLWVPIGYVVWILF